MKNSERKVILLASCLLTANLCMTVPVMSHAEEMQDNVIGVTDVVLLKKYLHGKQSITQEQFKKLDRNHDNLVNIYDFVILKQQLIQSEIVELPQEIHAVTAIDETASVTVAGWDSAMSDTAYTFETFQNFDETITELLKPAVVRSLEKTYDEEFFKNNVLHMNLFAQEEDWFTVDSISVTCQNHKLYINYEITDYDDYVSAKQVIISQVAVPKTEYSNYDSVVWDIENTQPIHYEYEFDCIEGIDYSSENRRRPPKLICSYDKLLEYVDTLNDFQKETALEKYPAEFFETKAVCLRPVCYAETCAKDTVWNVRKQGKALMFNVKVPQLQSDWIGGTIGLGQLIFNKSDVENLNIDVSCHEFSAVMGYYMSNETFDGEMLQYYIPEIYRTITVNQYRFKDKNVIEFYWDYSFDHMGYELIDSIDVDLDYKPFTGDVDNHWNDCEGENYSIIYDEDKNSIIVK
ncbi:MAG: dockerin type I repeat-containing protein, partial [Oscillospiraceae bacterium]|nr:dockerin type I repeat-containing protein [Oscillospiraceae bacterium]